MLGASFNAVSVMANTCEVMLWLVGGCQSVVVAPHLPHEHAENFLQLLLVFCVGEKNLVPVGTAENYTGMTLAMDNAALPVL